MNQRNARIALLVSFTAFVVLVVWQRVPTPELLIGDSSRTQLDTQRPNILFLMSDSQDGRTIDPTDTSVFPVQATPNLDQLRARGVNFIRAYSANPQCTPSRATILTGRRTDQIRVWANGGGLAQVPSSGLPDARCRAVYGSAYCKALGRSQNVTATWVDSMAAVGYEVHVFGKTHTGAGFQNMDRTGGAEVALHVLPHAAALLLSVLFYGWLLCFLVPPGKWQQFGPLRPCTNVSDSSHLSIRKASSLVIIATSLLWYSLSELALVTTKRWVMGPPAFDKVCPKEWTRGAGVARPIIHHIFNGEFVDMGEAEDLERAEKQAPEKKEKKTSHGFYKDSNTLENCQAVLRSRIGGKQPMLLHCSFFSPHPPFSSTGKFIKRIDRSLVRRHLPVQPDVASMHPVDRFTSTAKRHLPGIANYSPWQIEEVRSV